MKSKVLVAGIILALLGLLSGGIAIGAILNPVTIVMDADKVVTAQFSEIPLEPPITYNLTIQVEGSGTTIPSPGVYKYEAGTVVEITAIPDEGWQLDGWITFTPPSSEAGWISPTGYNEPCGWFDWHTHAYDNSEETGAEAHADGAWIEFTLTTPMNCDKVRIMGIRGAFQNQNPLWSIAVYYGGTYHTIFTGQHQRDTESATVWNEVELSSIEVVSKAKITYNTPDIQWITEFELHEVAL